MATTGTFAYNPAASNLTLMAFGRMGLKRTEIVAQHMADAEQEANLLQVEFSNRQPNMFLNELYTVTMVEGTAEYTLPSRLVAIQAAYLTTTSNGVSQDRIVWPISAFEYAALPDKTSQAPPTSYWLSMTSTPSIYMWPVPDLDDTYTLKLRMLTQVEDVALASGKNVAVPYRFLDAWVWALASRLAQIYKPEIAATLDVKAERSFQFAAAQDAEAVPTYILPAMSTYHQ